MRRRPLGPPVAQIAVELDDLKRRFAYPLVESGGQITIQGGGKGGTPTIVVAAANSTSISQTKADFQCSGANDDVVIQQALDICAVTGGRVLLSEGNFVCAAGIEIPSFTHLSGMNKTATYVEFSLTTSTGTGIDATRQDVQVRDLTVDIYTSDCSASGLVGIRMASSQQYVENVEIFSEGWMVVVGPGTGL